MPLFTKEVVVALGADQQVPASVSVNCVTTIASKKYFSVFDIGIRAMNDVVAPTPVDVYAVVVSFGVGAQDVVVVTSYDLSEAAQGIGAFPCSDPLREVNTH